MSAAQDLTRPHGGFTRAWGRLETFASTRAAAITLFLVALGVYAIESVFLPVVGGRDFGTYLLNYQQLSQWHATVPMWSLMRPPLASALVGGPLDLGGGWLAEIFLGLLFAAAVVSWTLVAAKIGRRVAIVTAVILLAYPAFSILFHQDSSDVAFAAALGPWALLSAWAVERPSLPRFAAAGFGVGLLGLIRPGNQVLLALGLFCLVLSLPFRRRLAYLCAFVAVGYLPLLMWSINNLVRYDDFTVVRGGSGLVFSRAFLHGMFSPDNGPASRKLVRAVETDLLPTQPYRAYRITVRKFLDAHSYRMLIDLYALSDRDWGWGSDYAILRKAGVEAVKRHPATYAGGVIGTIWKELFSSVYASETQIAPQRTGPARVQAQPSVTTVGNPKLPVPSKGEPIPASHESQLVATPHRTIREVWASPTSHYIKFDNPKAQLRYNALNGGVDRLGAGLPPYAGNVELTHRFNQANRVFPPLFVWLAVGLIAVAIRRVRGSALLLALTAGALLVLITTAIGVDAVGEYAVPFAPVFILLAVAGLFGEGARPFRLAPPSRAHG